MRDFDNAIRESGKSTSIDSYPRDILGRLREMRDNIAKGRANGMTFQMDHRGIITSYNMMVSMSKRSGEASPSPRAYGARCNAQAAPSRIGG